MAVDSVFQPDIRGLDSCIRFIEANDLMPLSIVCVRADRGGLHPVILDASSCEDDEEIKRSLMTSVLLGVLSKCRK